MPRREDDDVAPRSGALGRRSLLLGAGFALAVGATLAVFLTDNPQFLRVAVVAVAWAFVLATFAAGRRGNDRVATALRISELRRAYEQELDREVSARREYELELENELRRETEDSVRSELDALRGDIASLSGLRDEVARVAALRDDVAALTSLRQELGQLAELRADMGRLRTEIVEQLSSEMLVERIVMRTQASRLPGDGSARPIDAPAAWADDVPPRELTGGWPAVRLDEPRGETRAFEQVRVERPAPAPVPPIAHPRPLPSWEAPAAEVRSWGAPLPSTRDTAARATSTWSVNPPPPSGAYSGSGTYGFDTYGSGTYDSGTYATPPPPPPAPSPTWDADPWLSRPFGAEPPPTPERPASATPRRSRHSADEPAQRPTATSTFSMTTPPRPSPHPRPAVPVPPVEPPPSPLDWLAARSLLDAPAAPPAQPEAPRRRRTDDEPAVTDPAEARTTARPVTPSSPVRIEDRGGYRVLARDPEPEGGNRLAEILAENGVTPASGGRRRRRYRDDDDADDVLARVLGRN